jgi:hypothetical protein
MRFYQEEAANSNCSLWPLLLAKVLLMFLDMREINSLSAIARM